MTAEARPPRVAPLWGELRYAGELARLLARPWPRGRAGSGDPEPVLLIPGFMAGDQSLSVLRGWLEARGHRVAMSGMRANVDCAERVVGRLQARLLAFASGAGRPVFVIGQSRGGAMARCLAVRNPHATAGLAMLGLGPPPPMPELATVFKAQPDLSVFAGAGLGRETLVPLFRHATIKRIDQVYEFRLDRKRLAVSPSGSAPGEELREALRTLDALPPFVADLLATKSKAGGKVGIRWCSALVKPESPEVLAAIREHPQLKGYLEPGAPPGYLLLKRRTNPDNFVRRCQDLGFDVHTI